MLAEQTIQETESHPLSPHTNGSADTARISEAPPAPDASREARVARLNWLAGRMPEAEYLTFPGGLMSKCLFEEAHHSFVYGQFLATIVLGFAFVERTLPALFRAQGMDEIEQESLKEVLHKARSMEWVTQQELDALERAQMIPNPGAHFRRPPYHDSIEYQSAPAEGAPYTLIERDALNVITVVMNLLARRLVVNQ